ncbi:MAG TPA: L-dopachrome tautomerase-related protein [Candidatus Nitrosocosmicus sp.]
MTERYQKDSSFSVKDIPAQGLPTDESVGALEPVAFFNGPMPTGITVSQNGRMFVNFPRWEDDVQYTVAEIIKDGYIAPYPDEIINKANEDDLASSFVSVQSIIIDPLDRLWVLDTGSPLFKPTEYGGPKLICIDINTNKIIKKILFPQSVVLSSSYLNDLRIDLRRGQEGMAFITDSSQKGPNGIIVADLASGESWRRLEDHPSTMPEDLQTFLPMVEGRPFLEQTADGSLKQGANMGIDGIAINADGSRIYYCPLGSRRLYSVDINTLTDRKKSDQDVADTVIDEGDKGGASDGLESDAEGNIYATNYEHNSILIRRSYDKMWEILVHDSRLLWPDTLCLAMDGYLYVMSNQLHRQSRYNKGRDLRRKPYTLFRIKVDAKPVLLL